MKRVVGAVVVAIGMAVIACGGPSKPPLTPDTDDPSLGADASVPDMPGAPTAPPAPAPKK